MHLNALKPKLKHITEKTHTSNADSNILVLIKEQPKKSKVK